MNLLAVNLQRSSAINVAIYGNFSGPKQQEIVVSRGNLIELLRPDEAGKMVSVCSTPVFAVVRSLLAFRMTGANRDLVVIGSDSGKISILEFDLKNNDWKLLHCETYGKTGCRRIVPGQYLAADPKGRALLVAAVEKQKFVYIMNRDSSNKLTISSPLEAFKAETILFSACGVDVGFDNPVFAMIELEYTEADQDATGEALQEVEKKLTYYELDLGLNHVVRRWSEPISRTANFLLSVPGGDNWPSGVLICGENWVSYKHQGHVEVRTSLPRRHDLPLNRGVLITTGTIHKQKDLFFFLLQSEYGDLYKVTLEMSATDSKVVTNVVVTVFDSIQPANSLCITKSALLFSACEFGNHYLFQFQGIDDPNAIRSERILDDALNEELGDDSYSASRVAPLFKANPKLQNLLLAGEMNSLAPITEMIVEDFLGEGDSPQVVVLCGKGHRSTIRTLRHGVAVSEMAVSELPGQPTAVWTVKKSVDDEFDHYIVVSFNNATLVLSIGENVEEVTDSGFLATSGTLQAVLLADNALIQVHNLGIRHIRPDKRTSEWKTPGKRFIQQAAANSRQVAITLSGGEITYFELDATGQLMEMGSVDMGQEVSSLDLGVVPEGRMRSLFLAVGLWDDTVKLLFLDPNDILGKGPSIPVTSRPTSLCLVESIKSVDALTAAGGTILSNTGGSNAQVTTTLHLNIGLEKGVIQRVAVDQVTGDFSDMRERFLGPKQVKLCRVTMQGAPSVIALTNKPWLLYHHHNRYLQDPIAYEALEHACDFSSEACPNGIVAISKNTLRIFTVNNLGELFHQISSPLRYTPRKMCTLGGSSSGSKELVIIETDHNEFNEVERQQIAIDGNHPFTSNSNSNSNSNSSNSNSSSSSKAVVSGDAVGPPDVQLGEVESKSGVSLNENNQVTTTTAAPENEEDEDGTVMPVRGPVPPNPGTWASCIRILDPVTQQTKGLLELQNNEAAFSICTCKFTQHSEETFLVVGTCTDLLLHPKQWKACHINVYRVLQGLGTLQLLHKTEVEDIPMCLVEFQGKLLAGVGKCLRLFDLGKRKLLKKCENKLFPSAIVRIQQYGDRIYVGTLMDSIHFVKYRRQENAVLSIFADDAIPRFIVAMCILDYYTVAAVDKFGQVFVLRLPEDANDEATAGSSRLLWDQGVLNGAPNKLQLLCNYYLGEAATAVVKCCFKSQGTEVLLVSTIMGGLHAFVPFATKEEVSFFQHLEMFMRQEFTNFCHRDHLAYRSYFLPVKNTVDGELCEKYMTLSYGKQKEFGDDVDARSTLEIIKRLEEIRDFV